MSEEPTMECQDARASIQAYLDGELNEERAAPLRRHLLDCQPCRASAQSDKNLKRWFSKAKAPLPAIPRDFSARVARRAFAGDPGERFSEPRTITVGSGMGEMAVASRPDERNLRFVLALTAAAAVMLFVLTIAIQGLGQPSGSRLLADEGMTHAEAVKCLERLNQAASPAPIAPAKPAESKQ